MTEGGAGMAAFDRSRAEWRKSTRSGATGDCVEVAFVDGVVGVRDSKNPTGPVLVFTGDEWAVFIVSVRSGQLS
jgi:Domain of unknown function (DUF397)